MDTERFSEAVNVNREIERLRAIRGDLDKPQPLNEFFEKFISASLPDEIDAYRIKLQVLKSVQEEIDKHIKIFNEI